MAEAALDLAEKEQGICLDAMDAQNLLAQGKRNLLCGEVPNAVNQFQEASRLLAAKFGDTSDECAEAYYCYGKALLELSRMESGVLGNALQGIDEDEEEKSDEKSDKSDDKSEKSDDKSEKSSEDKSTDDRIEQDDITEGETSQEEAESEDIADEGEEGEAEGEGEEGEGEEEEGDTEEEEKKEEEDVGNLQIAWEMLELSKIIYKRHSSNEKKSKLADTFLKLGEVGLETEQYETAIGDFKECLKLQKELLDSEDRGLAETYYQLGLACCFNGHYDESVDYYRNAANTIEAKMGSLKKVVEDAEKESKGKELADPENPVVKAQKELKDLQEIIPDIMAKIEDVLEEKRNADQMKKLVKDNVAADLGTISTGFGQTTKTTETKTDSAPTDITHLVRKKRKPEEDCEDTTKKAKTDKTEDGSGDAPKVNGSTEVNDTSEKVNGKAEEVAAS